MVTLRDRFGISGRVLLKFAPADKKNASLYKKMSGERNDKEKIVFLCSKLVNAIGEDTFDPKAPVLPTEIVCF